MLEKRKARKRAEAIQAKFPLFPFEDLHDPETYGQATGYLRERHEEVSHLRAVPGECEYVVRSYNLPDRRLAFPDQRLWQRMRRLLNEQYANRDAEFETLFTAPMHIGHVSVESVILGLPSPAQEA